MTEQQTSLWEAASHCVPSSWQFEWSLTGGDDRGAEEQLAERRELVKELGEDPTTRGCESELAGTDVPTDDSMPGSGRDSADESSVTGDNFPTRGWETELEGSDEPFVDCMLGNVRYLQIRRRVAQLRHVRKDRDSLLIISNIETKWQGHSHCKFPVSSF